MLPLLGRKFTHSANPAQPSSPDAIFPGCFPLLYAKLAQVCEGMSVSPSPPSPLPSAFMLNSSSCSQHHLSLQMMAPAHNSPDERVIAVAKNYGRMMGWPRRTVRKQACVARRQNRHSVVWGIAVPRSSGRGMRCDILEANAHITPAHCVALIFPLRI